MKKERVTMIILELDIRLRKCNANQKPQTCRQVSYSLLLALPTQMLLISKKLISLKTCKVHNEMTKVSFVKDYKTMDITCCGNVMNLKVIW